MITHTLFMLIRNVSEVHGVDPCVLAALVDVESHGMPGAVRTEPVYWHPWDVATGAPFRRLGAGEAVNGTAPSDFPGGQQEWTGQRASYGLAQVMGAVARERGFAGPWEALLDPETNLELACAHLTYLQRHGKDEFATLVAYHAGDPESAKGIQYAHKVLARAVEMRRAWGGK